MTIRVSASQISGHIRMHGSKSLSQRYILLSAFSGTPLVMTNRSWSEDEEVAIRIAKGCGSVVSVKDDAVTVDPNFHCPDVLDVGQSATSLRLVLGLLAAKKCRTEISMAPSLATRPHEDLLESLKDFGGNFSWIDPGKLNADLSGLSVLPYSISGSSSSQFVSSLIMMNALGSGKAEVRTSYGVASAGYIDLTIQALQAFGYTVVRQENLFRIEDMGRPDQVTVRLEGDYSSAAFLLTLGALTSENGIVIDNLPIDSRQPDAVYPAILKKAHAAVRQSERAVIIGKERVGKVTLDVDANPDLAPPISVLGMFNKEGVVLRNCKILEIKESNRLSAIGDLAQAFGTVAERIGNDLIMRPSTGKVTSFPEFSDHRMVMALVIASIISGVSLPIKNEGATIKSYGNFLDDLKRLGVSIVVEEDKEL